MNDAFKRTIDSNDCSLVSNPSIRGLSRREAIERIGKLAVYTASTIGVIVDSEEVHAQREDRAARGFRRRIGFDAGQNAIEGALAFAAKNNFHFVDFNADRGANDLRKWSRDRVNRQPWTSRQGLTRFLSTIAIRAGSYACPMIPVR